MEALATRPDLVWAKFTDYPWWPAFLTGVKGAGKREVIFFGIFDRSFVPEKNIRAFENQPAFAKKDAKNAALKASIASARAVSRGESSLEAEYLKIAGVEVETTTLGTLSIEQKTSNLPKACPKTPLKVRKESKCITSLSTFQEFPQSPPDIPSPRFCSKSEREKSKDLPFETQPQTTTAEFAAASKLRRLVDELLLFNLAFEQNFTEFSQLARRLLAERSTDELFFSGVGQLISGLGRSLEANQHIEAVARRLPEFHQLLQTARTEILNRFFGESSKTPINPIGQAKAESAPTVKPCCLRVDQMIQNRVEKKLAKVLKQGCGKLASKNDCQSLAKLTQFAIQKTAKNLLEYKGKVVTLVVKRREEFVRAASEMLAKGEISDRWHLALEGLAV